MARALEGKQPGDQVTITIRRISDGTLEDRQIPLSNFPVQGRVAFFVIPYAVGLIFLATSLWIFGMRRTEAVGRGFAVFATSVAVASGGLFDLYTTHWMTWLWIAGVAIAGGALIDLALTFPVEIPWIKEHRYVRWIGYTIGAALTIIAEFIQFNLNQPTAYIKIWGIVYFFAGLSVLFFVAATVYRRVTAKSPVVRQQASTLLLGMIIAFGPLAIWLLVTQLLKGILPSLNLFSFSPFLLVFSVIFPVIMGYTILRYRI